MRLLIFVNSYSEVMETFIFNHIEYMSKLSEFDLTVLCHYYPDRNFNIDSRIEVIVSNVASYKDRGLFAGLFICRNPRKAFRLLKYGGNTWNGSLLSMAANLNGQEYDLIHAHFGQNGKMIGELIDAGIIKGKLITMFHGLDVSHKYPKGFYEILNKIKARCLANSNYTKQKIKDLGINGTSITVIPVGTKAGLFENKSTTEVVENRYIYVGRLLSLKGVQYFPEIVKKLLERGFSNFKIYIIGLGPLKSQIEREIGNLDQYIELVGYKKPSDIKKLMGLSKIFLYPGIYDINGRAETQGLVFQEAMFMKVPIIATNVGGIPECVKEGETGCLVEPHDLDSFVEKIILLSENNEYRSKMANQAYDFVYKKYEMNVVMKQIINIYNT